MLSHSTPPSSRRSRVTDMRAIPSALGMRHAEVYRNRSLSFRASTGPSPGWIEIEKTERHLVDLQQSMPGKIRRMQNKIEALEKASYAIRREARISSARALIEALQRDFRETVDRLSGQYAREMQTAAVEQTQNHNPDKIPDFQKALLPDQGQAFDVAYPNKRALIANRGQYAMHAYLSLKRLGFEVFVVTTAEDLDLKTSPLTLLDREHIVEVDNYTNFPAIIDRAKSKKIDCILPGYGFKSESHEFSKLCEDSGIKFIGPSDQPMLAAGDKVDFKNRLLQNGQQAIPGPTWERVLPGGKRIKEFITFTYDFNRDVNDPNCNHALRESLTWMEREFAAGRSVMLKATSAGGGKGIRQLKPGDDFGQKLIEVYNEARSYVKEGEEPHFLLERDLGHNSLHIEAQVIGYRKKDGKIGPQDEQDIEIFLRNCSLQTSGHQKMVEIGLPDQLPNDIQNSMLPQKVADAIKNYARSAAAAIGYDNLGTIEFLYSPETGEFYPLEMNTRIQVEAIVTGELERRDMTATMLAARAGYKAAEIAEASPSPKKPGLVAQVRLTGGGGTVDKVRFAEGPGIIPYTHLYEGCRLSTNLDRQFGSYLVSAPNMLCLLLKLRVVVEKTLLEGKDAEGKNAYTWDQQAILAAINRAIELHKINQTPTIETVAQIESAGKLSGTEIISKLGGMIFFGSRRKIRGVIPLEKDVCLGPDETIGIIEANKAENPIKNGPHYVRVVEVLVQERASIARGIELLKTVPITEAEFQKDRARRIEKIRSNPAQIFAEAVRNTPTDDPELANLAARALEHQRPNYNIEIIEVGSGWKPEDHGYRKCEKIDEGEGLLTGVDMYTVAANESRLPRILPKWFASAQKHPEKKTILITVHKGHKLFDSSIDFLAGRTPTNCRYGYQDKISPQQAFAWALLSGKNKTSLKLLDTLMSRVSDYDANLLASSKTHFTAPQMVDHWVKSGKVERVEEIPSEDKAFYMAKLHLAKEHGGYPILLLAQKMGGPEANNGMGTEVSFREMKETLERNSGIPVLLFSNTIGADPSREPDPARLTVQSRLPYFGSLRRGEEIITEPQERLGVDDMNLGIHQAVLAALDHDAPIVSYIVNCASGGGLPLVIANRNYTGLSTGNIGVIGPTPCALILQDEEIATPALAAEFLKMRQMQTNRLVDGKYDEPLTPRWGFDKPKIFDGQFKLMTGYLGDELRWHELDETQRRAKGLEAREERQKRFGNFGEYAGVLQQKPIDIATLPEAHPPPRSDIYRKTLFSRNATHLQLFDKIAAILSGIEPTFMYETDDGGGEANAARKIEAIRAEIEQARKKKNYKEALDAIRGIVAATKARSDVLDQIRRLFENEPAPVSFTFFNLMSQQDKPAFRCPISGSKLLPSADMIFFGALGGLVDKYWKIPADLVTVRPGSLIDTEYRRARLERDFGKFAALTMFPDEPLGAFLGQDRQGERFLFWAPNTLTGARADVTRMASRMAQLAKELEIPLFEMPYTGGMSMDDGTIALMGMPDMSHNYRLLHEAIPDIQTRNPRMGHFSLIPFDAYGGNTASSTAANAMLSHDFITRPEGTTTPLLGGLFFVGDPSKIPVGFGGPKVVPDKTLSDWMAKMQKAQTWINCFRGSNIQWKNLNDADSVQELIETLLASHERAHRKHVFELRKRKQDSAA